MAADRRGHWPVLPLLAVLGVWGALASAPAVAGAEPILVAVPKIGGSAGVLWSLEDTNGDGDALDPGERKVFRDSTGAGPLTDDFTDVAQSRSGAVYAIEGSTGRVFRFVDLNSDGDAQDPGEAAVFRDGNAEGMRLKAAASIAVTQTFDVGTGTLQDVVFVYDPILQATARLQDKDGDGDAQSYNEICLFHQSIISKPLTVPRMTTDDAGRLLAANPNRRAVVRVIDFNGDCNASVPNRETQCPAQLVPNEYHVVKDVSGVSFDLLYPLSIAYTPEKEAIFVGEPGRSQSSDGARVLRLVDTNDNENAQDAGEVSLFSNGRCRDVPYVNPVALAVDKGRALYLADFFTKEILRLQDLNSDGDALDDGECNVFAAGLGPPVGLAIQPPPLPTMAIHLGTGILDLGKKTDLLLPDGATANFELQVVDRDAGTPVPNAKVACDVISGCLQCAPKSGRTNSTGNISFTVSRIIGPPRGDEGLIVSTLGDSVPINVTPFIPIECPFAALLEGTPRAKIKKALIDSLKDDVLSRTRNGQRYIGLFNRHALEVTLRLMADRPLRLQAQQLMERLLPVLQQRMAKGPAGTAAISPADVSEVDDLMEALTTTASPELRQTLQQLRKELKAGRITGSMGIVVKAKDEARSQPDKGGGGQAGRPR